MYDPELGRFLSVDPLFEMQIGINPYHYCYNDPVNASDPSGLCSDCGEDCVIGPFYGNVNGGDNKKQSSVPGSWVDSELSANDYAVYGIKNKFNSHSADQLLVSHNSKNYFNSTGTEGLITRDAIGATIVGRTEHEVEQLYCAYTEMIEDPLFMKMAQKAETEMKIVRIMLQSTYETQEWFVKKECQKDNSYFTISRNGEQCILLSDFSVYNPNKLHPYDHKNWEWPWRILAYPAMLIIGDYGLYYSCLSTIGSNMAHEYGHFVDRLFGIKRNHSVKADREENSIFFENVYLNSHRMDSIDRY